MKASLSSWRVCALLYVFAQVSIPKLYAQDLTNSDYEKALWMTTRFYGGQRSSDTNHMERHNWLLYDHLPSGVDSKYRGNSFSEDNDYGYDLSGGWFDCGDHVKFGQTQYYSAYMLLKAYSEFKAGFGDYYSDDFSGYAASGDWTWEGGSGQPNGIPDVLDEVRHATDYFIKCARDENTFYFEVGNGSYDHTTWVTSTKMQTQPETNGGNPRDIGKNPSDGAMPSFCAATLALMAREYEQFDPDYAEECIKHAKYAYHYASQYVGAAQGAASGGFYGPNSNSKNAWGICLAEMYWLTKDSTYIDELDLLSIPADITSNDGYTFDYSNNGELALYVLAQLGKSGAQTKFNNRIETHWNNATSYNSEGVYKEGGSWGKLRYVANASFLIALYDKLNGNSLDTKVFDNIDYILGANTSKQSFVVGFAPDNTYIIPEYPHHRNAYLNDNNVANGTVISMPTKNEQFGALLGGSLTSSGFADNRDDFVNNEVCIDYNAGLVAGLGAIRAEIDPVDTSLFINACSSPDLGGDKYLCNSSPVNLNTQLTTQSNVTFEWFKDGVSQGSPSGSANTYSTTETGTWKVVIDSAGVCHRVDEIEVFNDIPTIDFGEDFEICASECVSLETDITGDELTIVWQKDGLTLSNTSPSLEVSTTGTYSATVSLSGCTTQSDEINITSHLPTVMNGNFCAPETATLQITEGSGDYEWFETPISNTVIHTGASYTTPILTADKTYYVADVGLSTKDTVGLDAAAHGLTNGNFGTGNPSDKAFVFNALQDVTLTGFTIEYSAPWTNESLTLNLYDDSGSILETSSIVVPAGSGTVISTLTFTSAIPVPTGNDYILKIEGWNNTNTIIYRNSSGNNPYPYSDGSYLEVTGPHPDIVGSEPYSHPAFFDLQIAVGSVCTRKSVSAIDTCAIVSGTEEQSDISDIVSVFPNPTSGKVQINTPYSINKVIVRNTYGIIVAEGTDSVIDMESQRSGVYYLTILTEHGTAVKKLIRN